jgi:hypothetical protein
MRIFVASLAFSKTDTRILHVAVGFQVALGALQSRMPACDGEIRRLVVEFRNRREVLETVTALTLHSELTLVLVLVARGAGRPQAQEGS